MFARSMSFLYSLVFIERSDITFDDAFGHFWVMRSRNDALVDGTVDIRYHSSSASPSVVYHPLGSIRARNPGVTTEVVSNISRQKKGKDSQASNYSAICTLDGHYSDVLVVFCLRKIIFYGLFCLSTDDFWLFSFVRSVLSYVKHSYILLSLLHCSECDDCSCPHVLCNWWHRLTPVVQRTWGLLYSLHSVFVVF